MNTKMVPSELKRHIVEFLKEYKSGSLATCIKGIPRSSPVQYFMGNNLDIYIISAGGDKFDAIKENPNVCLLVNTEYISYRQIKGVQVFGKASTSVENSSLFDEAKEYCPDKNIMIQEKDKIKVIKIHPDEIVYLDSLSTGNRTKQILRNDQVVIKEEKILVAH
ncbi:pyridoxamine 5'-phosphate oxidase family protein [Clostridium sp. DJ247]|uniref:pyridoxamine 5'-phosphate oxidase family protein n=1 Tax=Clostridium sp. DJ247 TaxID=2726188 RepID=UPI00162A4286|nr:pyridoxamine 5'-phosphate oxidase family protein [Clostridium sp. DJ247]MBC2579464.1 pyridoxamine 5'-phosphate oxidase family protein [Clostridium sp. DJ247]